jgi:hypothetical protein
MVADAVPKTVKVLGRRGPSFVHTTVLSAVVPPTVSFHSGEIAPLIPAVVTSCMFPDGSSISFPS